MNTKPEHTEPRPPRITPGYAEHLLVQALEDATEACGTKRVKEIVKQEMRRND